MILLILLIGMGGETIAAGRTLRDAETAFADGRYLEAAAAFEEVFAGRGRPRTAYAAGSAYLLGGEYRKAVSLLASAATGVADAKTAAKYHYNLGNAYAKLAGMDVSPSVGQGMSVTGGADTTESSGAMSPAELLRKAARSYERAFALDRSLEEAVFNAELVKRRLAEFNREQQQEQDQQQEQERQRERRNPDDENVRTGEQLEQDGQAQDTPTGDPEQSEQEEQQQQSERTDMEQSPQESSGQRRDIPDRTEGSPDDAGGGEQAQMSEEEQMVESILGEEEENREHRETFRIRGGITEVERDW